MDDTTAPALLEQLAQADRRLASTVAALPRAAYAEPSSLTGWTRGHVVAHLVLNAEALAGVLVGLSVGPVPPMYPSSEQRDTDIAALAPAAPEALLARLTDAATALVDATSLVPETRWDVLVARSRGSDRTFPAHAIPGMRLREVEIHHADLAAGYTHRDWPLPFGAFLVASMMSRSAPTAAFSVAPTDRGATWQAGASNTGPVVSGTVADLGWWLTGRGSGHGLTSSDGTLPRMEAW